MSIIDKISLGILDKKAKVILSKEVRANNRAAGSNKTTGQAPSNIAHHFTDIVYSNGQRYVEAKAENIPCASSSDEDDAKSIAEDAIEKACDAEVLAENAILKADEAISATNTLKAMAEEAIYKAHEANDAITELAEKESPTEEVGAEKMESKDMSAAMGTIVRPVQEGNNDPSKIDMSIFGVSIDNDSLRATEQKRDPVPAPQQSTPSQQFCQPQQPMPVQNVPQQYCQPQPMAYYPNPMVPMVPIQPVTVVGPGGTVNSVVAGPAEPSLKNKFFERQMNSGVQSPFIHPQEPPTPGFGNHKVDYPNVPKEKPVKNPPEVIESNIPTLVQPEQEYKKIDAKDISIVTDVEATDTTIVKKSIFDNSMMISKYPFLGTIEKIAVDNGYQICFNMKANGTNMIECHVCDQNSNEIMLKSFTIDNGNIIDGRKKIFPVIAEAYESYTAYALFASSGNDMKNLDEEVIKSLIIGGPQAISRKPLFNQQYIDLNKVVALITIPGKRLKKDERKYIQSRLMDVLVRTDVLKKYVGRTRFRVASFDNGTITLISNGVPLNYGGHILSADNVTIKITKDSVDEIA